MYIMAYMLLKLCVLFSLIKYSELCAGVCNLVCDDCPKPKPPPPKPPPPPPCCTNPPCDYDAEVVFGPPKKPTPPNCRQCTPKPGACDPPSHPDVPILFHPGADDAPPQFLAAIVNATGGGHICGAAIISPHFVISNSRRCMSVSSKQVASDSIKVAIGHFNSVESDSVVINKHKVISIQLHPGCFTGTKYNPKHDLALVQVLQKIVFDQSVQAASFPPRTGWRANANRTWYLSSFRANHLSASSPREAIWYVKVRLVQPDLCKNLLKLDNQTKETIRPVQHYCTPYEHPTRKDGCKDDYGAALSYDNILFGILIFKFSCGRPRSVAGYVDLAPNRDWVAEKVKSLSKEAESIT